MNIKTLSAKKWPLLAVTMILLVALLGISSSVVSAEQTSGTAGMVVSVIGFNGDGSSQGGTQGTYMDIRLNGGSKLHGWCADDIRTITVGENYTAHIYDYFGDYYGNATKMATLPSWVKHHDDTASFTVNWTGIAYVINNKQGGFADIQKAIWYFSDDGGKPSSGSPARDMVDAAITYQANHGLFVPGPGQLKPIICYVADHQVVFYECQIPSHPAISVVKGGVVSGNVISYTFNVTNSGDVTLYNVTVSDNPALTTGPTPAKVASLAPGQWTIFTGTYNVTAANKDAGYVSDTVTATGTPPCGPVVTNTASMMISLEVPPPVPELPTIVLLSIGLVGLAGWFGVRRRKSMRQA